MDPNETLADLRAALKEEGDVEAAWARFEDLDEWMSRGGFLPSAWNHSTKSKHVKSRG